MVPGELLVRRAAVMKGEPVAHEAGGNVEHDGRLLAMMGLVLTEHCAHIRHADPLELAISIPPFPLIFMRRKACAHWQPIDARRLQLRRYNFCLNLRES